MIHAFDTETYPICDGNPLPKGVCLSYASENGDRDVLTFADGLLWLREKLERGDHLVAHNAPFDEGVCAATDPILLPLIYKAYNEGRLHDTVNRQKILDNARGALKTEWDPDTDVYSKQKYDLAFLVHKYLGRSRFHEKTAESWRLNYYLLDGVPICQYPPEAREYSLADSVDALELFFYQENDDAAYLLIHEPLQSYADWALSLMSVWGSRTNQKGIDRLKDEYGAEFDKYAKVCIENKLARYITKNGVKVPSKNMKAIRKEVADHYEKYGIEVPLTKKGQQVATDRDTLLMEKYKKIQPTKGMVAVERMGFFGKKISTYIKALSKGIDCPINPHYNAIIETFRTSCAKPNIQNIPRKGGERECWQVRPGYVYGFCDYDTLEMRTLAQVYLWMFNADTCALLEAIKEGKDLHVVMAADILHIGYEEAISLYESEDELLDKTRTYSKIGNYGLSGGMGPDAFIDYARGYGIEISLKEARQIRAAYLKTWNMKRYFDRCGDLARTKNPKLGINQIEFYGTGLVRGNVPYTAVCNGFFQHLAAIGAKIALCQVSEACYVLKDSPLYNCRPWLFAHDEIGLEVPFDGTEEGRIRASNAMKELERIMVESMKQVCPDVPIGATAALAFQWIKGAKPIYRDIHGQKTLVPCKKVDKQWVEQYTREEV